MEGCRKWKDGTAEMWNHLQAARGRGADSLARGLPRPSRSLVFAKMKRLRGLNRQVTMHPTKLRLPQEGATSRRDTALSRLSVGLI